MSYSIDKVATQQEPEDEQGYIVPSIDYNTAQNNPQSLDEIETASTKLMRQSSLDVINKDFHLKLKKKKLKSKRGSDVALLDGRPSSRVIANTRSKVQSFHQRSQVINALYYKKALNTTRNSLQSSGKQ